MRVARLFLRVPVFQGKPNRKPLKVGFPYFETVPCGQGLILFPFFLTGYQILKEHEQDTDQFRDSAISRQSRSLLFSMRFVIQAPNLLFGVFP